MPLMQRARPTWPMRRGIGAWYSSLSTPAGAFALTAVNGRFFVYCRDASTRAGLVDDVLTVAPQTTSIRPPCALAAAHARAAVPEGGAVGGRTSKEQDHLTAA